MRNLLAFSAAAALTFAGVGYYLDWYHVRTGPATRDGHQNVNIDIDSVKMAHDVHHGVQEGEKKIEQIIEKQQAQSSARSSEVSRWDPPARLPTPAFPSSTARSSSGPDGH